MRNVRIEIIDYLKAICIVFVIILHSSAPYELGIENSILYVYFFKMAVPIFMVLSGYTAAMTSQKIQNIKECYRLNKIIEKFIRFTMPILVCIIFYLLVQIVKGVELDFSKVCDIIFMAKFGSGAYYYHLMIQFIFISPLIVLLVRKYLEGGVVFFVVANLLYEIGIQVCNVDEMIYRILIFRYLTEIALGVYICYKKEKIKLSTLGMLIFLGGGYIFALKYCGYEEKLFTYWTDTNMIVSFWIFPIVYLIIYCFKYKKIEGRLGQMFSLFGKASYHIFCTQMVWFSVGSFVGDKILYMFSPYIKTIIAIVVCLFFGTCFYLVEQWGRKRI